MKILDLIRKKGELMITGNREYYEGLLYKKDKFIHHGGDTMANEETHRSAISDEKALEKIMDYYKDKAGTFQSQELKTPEEILAYMQEHLHI